MARAYEEFARRGATIAAIVIDTPEQNAAMAAKLAVPFPILSDPGGEHAIKPIDVWDETGNMARPAILVLAPDGTEVFRYVGADFMDRPDDSALFDALSGLNLPPVDVPAETIAHLSPAPSPRAVVLSDLAVYLRGARFAMIALAGRAHDDRDKAEAERSAQMSERFIAAQGATMRVTQRL